MALRRQGGEPIALENEWVEFFMKQMKFPQKSSEKYAKYLCKEGFDGEVLEQSIEDADMKDNLGMLVGEYKKLRIYIRSTLDILPAGTTGCTRSGPISKIPRPHIKLDSKQLEFEQFVFEWNRYKSHYQLCGEQASTNLFFCCSDEIRQHIRTKQSHTTSSFNWSESELLDLIKDIACSKVSAIVHVKEFLTMQQQADERCQDYLRRLQIKASCCAFKCSSCNASNAEKRVKEKFILGLKSSVIQTHVLNRESISPGTDLSKILTEAMTLEQSVQDQISISQTASSSVMAAEESDSDRSSDHVQALTRSYRQKPRRFDKTRKACSGCASREHEDHERSKKCKAWKIKCHNCRNVGHLSRVCRQGKNRKTEVQSAELSCMFIGEVSSLNLPIHIRPTNRSQFVNVDVFPDTGANICLLGLKQLQALKLTEKHLQKCNNQISVAGGTAIMASGWFNADFRLNGRMSNQVVYFSRRAKRFFLNRKTCMDLCIVPPSFPYPPPAIENSRQVAIVEKSCLLPMRPSAIPFEPREENITKLKKYLIDSFADSAFSKTKPFPKLSTPPAHIHLKPNYHIPKPAYWPAVVAEHWADEVKKSIDNDVQSGILLKIPFNEPTTWCARMVVVRKKDGRPRRTVDFQQLNKQCLREPNHGIYPFHAARKIL